MTNEDIEKRFLFDLEMGVFKTADTKDERYNDRIIVFINNKERSIMKLIRLLYSINYKKRNFSYVEDSSMIVIIDKANKTFKIESLSNSFYYDTPNTNELPNYIKEYRI